MLKQLHLKNWRSLRDVTIDFTPITVFIGANSSGKTNIIDALKFRRYSMRNGLRQANSRWNLSSEVLTQGTFEKSVELSLLYIASDGQEFPNKLKVEFKKFAVDYIPPLDYVNNDMDNKPLRESFQNFFSKRIQILEEGFRPEIYQSRNLDQPLDLIEGQAGNMLAILDYMQDKNVAPDIYEKFSEEFRYVLSHVDSVDIKSDEREFQLLITERQLKARTISAGTARVAAMLTALHMLDIPPEKPSEEAFIDSGLVIIEKPMNEDDIDPGLVIIEEPMNEDDIDPGLVIIEEPDAALNPGVLENLVNVMRRFTEGDKPRQIILTTHNPTFLNYFKPEEVRVVERDEEGITQVYPVPHDILEGLETIDTLGDVWLTRALGGIGG